MNKLSADKVYYIRKNGVISECKFTYVKQMYSRANSCDCFLNSVKYEVVLPNGEKMRGEGHYSHPGYWKLFDVFETIEDCKYNVNAIKFNEFYNLDYLFNLLYNEGFGVERNRYGQFLFFYWDGFKATAHNYYVITENVLTEEFTISPQKKSENENGVWKHNEYEMYRTARECENAHQVKVITFAEVKPEQTPEQKRIKELETIIKNAQAELAKIGN